MEFTIDYLWDNLYVLIQYIYSRVGYLFYLVNPSKWMFETVDDVPRYVAEVGIKSSIHC